MLQVLSLSENRIRMSRNDTYMTGECGRKLPFAVNRLDARSFVEQVVQGLREAIAAGVYKPGDRLPTWREMALQLKVSEKVPRQAIARLSREGLVVSRRSVGARIAEGVQRKWNGRVVFATQDVGCSSYFIATLLVELRRLIVERGYLFETVTCPLLKDRTADPAFLVEALKRKTDLCVLNVDARTLSRVVSRLAKVPILAFDSRPDHRFRCDYVGIDCDAACPEFVHHCREEGIRRVLDMNLVQGGCVNVSPALRRIGISVETITVQKEGTDAVFSDIIRSSLEMLRKRLSVGNLPDLIVFNDDYVAIGRLQALLAERIDVPRDVRVVTFSNRGFGPVFIRPLTRFELDPVAVAVELADRIFAHLEKRPLPDVNVGTRYVRGETF